MALIFTDVMFILIFGGVLGFGAYYDGKTRNVPDMISASLWILFGLLVFLHPVAALGVAVFGMVYLLNTIFKQEMGWADILVSGPYIGVMIWIGSINSFSLLGLALAYISVSAVGIAKKKPQPLYPYLLLGYILSSITCA